MRVLLVEDEVALADAIARGLGAEGFEVEVVHDGLEGLERAREHRYAAIILDIMLPGMNGYQVCRTLRAEGDLDARSSCSRPRTASGTRPRRSTPAPTTSSPSRSRSWCWSPGCGRSLRRGAGPRPGGARGRRPRASTRPPASATAASVPIALTAREFALLEHLMRHHDEVVSKATLLDEVWGARRATPTPTWSRCTWLPAPQDRRARSTATAS